jgi:hypothetical protein
MKKNFLILLAVILVACSQNDVLVLDSKESTVHRMNFIETVYSPFADSIYHRFNILNIKTNNKELIGDVKPSEVEMVTTDNPLTLEGIRRLPLAGGTIPPNVVVSLLIDRSIHTEDMAGIKNAVSYIVDNLPENTAYISFFDDRLQESKRITPENMETFNELFSVTTNNKIIFDVASLKFQELSGSKAVSTGDLQFAAKINDENVRKVLVILTDGRVDANDLRTSDNIQKFSDAIQKIDDDPANKHRIEIHAIRYGEKNDDVDFTLSYLCVDIRNQNVKGGSYFADPVAFIENLKESDNAKPDYELVMLNPKGKIYQGKKHTTGFLITKSGTNIPGKVQYVIGTQLTPVKTGTKNAILPIVFGLTGGLIALGLCFLIMLLVIPYFRFKMENFNARYVRNYSFDAETVIKCHYCMNEIRDGDEIVTKCHHTVHKHCWIENGCKCTDYGKYCKRGKQFLYDSDHPFSINNRPYFTQWATFGMAGGLLSWLLFQVLLYFFPAPLSPLTQWLLSLFNNTGDYPLVSSFFPKLGALFVVGLLLGFTLVLLFSIMNRYRQLKKDTPVVLLLRSLVGAVFVFIMFLLSAFLFIPTLASTTVLLLDWIPWLLSGFAIGAVLFYNTNTIFKQIAPGVLLSGVLCFLILLTVCWFGNFAVVFGLMVFGGGVGISFISARKIIHKYFLLFKGVKSEKIAIHKWMSVAGGSREVSIGSGEDATIRMTWDDHPSIKDIHVKLFNHRKSRLPYIKILSSDVFFNGVFAKNNEEYMLKDGVKFTVGNTEFQYIE